MYKGRPDINENGLNALRGKRRHTIDIVREKAAKRMTLNPIPPRDRAKCEGPVVVEKNVSSVTLPNIKGDMKLAASTEEALHAKWCEVWLQILKDNQSECKLWESIEHLPPSSMKVVVHEMFSVRRSNTFAGHARGVTSYIRWCRASDVPPSPFKSSTLVSYFAEIREGRCAATTILKIKSALNFAREFLIVDGGRHIDTPIVRGIMMKKLSTKRCTKRAPALSVRAVLALELGCTNSPSLVSRYACAMFCLMIHGRSRFSDLQYTAPRTYTIDGEIVEARAVRTKTSEQRGRIREGVPTLARMRGLIGDAKGCWGMRLKELLAILSADKEADHMQIDYVFPVVNHVTDTFSFKPMNVTTATTILREMLIANGISQAEAKRYSTHSCKATVLCWAARYGMDESARATLGGHADGAGSRKCVKIYSREELDQPVVSLQHMYTDIRSGEFTPDFRGNGPDDYRVVRRPNQYGCGENGATERDEFRTSRLRQIRIRI